MKERMKMIDFARNGDEERKKFEERAKNAKEQNTASNTEDSSEGGNTTASEALATIVAASDRLTAKLQKIAETDVMRRMITKRLQELFETMQSGESCPIPDSNWKEGLNVAMGGCMTLTYQVFREIDEALTTCATIQATLGLFRLSADSVLPKED